MTNVTTLLAKIKTQSEGLTELCPEHLRQSIRHVQRNCDIECNTHGDRSTRFDCNQPERQDGDRMADALASIPRLIRALEAVAGLHKPDSGHNPECHCGIEAGSGAGCVECREAYPCPTITAVVAAIEENGR